MKWIDILKEEFSQRGKPELSESLTFTVGSFDYDLYSDQVKEYVEKLVEHSFLEGKMSPYRMPGGTPTEESRKPITAVEKQNTNSISETLPMRLSELKHDAKTMIEMMDLLDFIMNLKQ